MEWSRWLVFRQRENAFDGAEKNKGRSVKRSQIRERPLLDYFRPTSLKERPGRSSSIRSCSERADKRALVGLPIGGDASILQLRRIEKYFGEGKPRCVHGDAKVTRKSILLYVVEEIRSGLFFSGSFFLF